MNPDGREKATEKDCTSKIGQTNANGKDLDSDFLSKEFPLSFILCLMSFLVCFCFFYSSFMKVSKFRKKCSFSDFLKLWTEL